MENDHLLARKSGTGEPCLQAAPAGEKDIVPRPARVPVERDIGETTREYDHSSGDRNTRDEEDDWPEYHGGTQRNADPAGARGSDPKK